VQNLLVEIAAKRQKKVFEGLSATASSRRHFIQSQKNPQCLQPRTPRRDGPGDRTVEPAIYLFKDFHPFLTKNNFAIIRKLKDIAQHLKTASKPSC